MGRYAPRFFLLLALFSLIGVAIGSLGELVGAGTEPESKEPIPSEADEQAALAARIEAAIFQSAPTMITQEQLELLTFHPQVVEYYDNEENREEHQSETRSPSDQHPEGPNAEGQEEPLVSIADRLSIDLFLASAQVPAGEPVYAYFVMKANSFDLEQLPPGTESIANWVEISMSPNLHQGFNHSTGCDFHLRQLEGEPNRIEQGLHSIDLVEGTHLREGEFYCMRADLRRLGALNPGRYQIGWSYLGGINGWDTLALHSRMVEFVITAPPENQDVEAELPPLSPLRLFEVRENDWQSAYPDSQDPYQVMVQDAYLYPMMDNDFANALALGLAGKYYPDIHDLPSEDRILQATAQFEPRADEGVPNEISLNLSLNPQTMENRSVTLDTNFDLYMMIASREFAIDHFGHLLEPRYLEPAVVLDDDHEFNIRIFLPDDWHQMVGLGGTCQVRMILCHGVSRQVANFGGPIPDILQSDNHWQGLLASPVIEFEIPPHTTD